jgi:hypothetical protein
LTTWAASRVLFRAAIVFGVTLASSCDYSKTRLEEVPVERVVITDRDGVHWDITQAVVRYGFDAAQFRFGIGASQIRPFQSPAMAAPGDSGYPLPGDTFRVVGVEGAEARAYRVDDLLDVEIADDANGGAPYAVIVRPLLAGSSPSVHARTLDGDTLTLSASGWVYQNQSVLYDFESGSLWYRLGGQSDLTCINGAHLTRALSPRAFTVVRWTDWKGAHAQTRFMLRPPPGPPIGGE